MTKSQLYKYPRTLHLPWSPGRTTDDKILENTDHFLGKNVIITEKRDGENTSLYFDHYHARSLDSADHPSRAWVKKLWGSIRYDMLPSMRICGENLYAKHSIGYDDLETYFEVFSIWWDDKCLSWEATEEWCQLLGLKTVPVILKCEYNKIFDILLRDRYKDEVMKDGAEGYVIRLADEFMYDDFSMSMAKYVRKNHVQTSDHWMSQAIVPNKLRVVYE